MRFATLKGPVFVLLSAALLLGCSREDEPARKTPDEPSAGRESSPAVQQQAGGEDHAMRIHETAQEYMARRGDKKPLKAGEAIAQCVLCHGPKGEGNEDLGAPRIGGMAEWYLARQLKYFKTGVRAPSDADRYGTQMRAIVLPLDVATIEDLAAYISTLDPPPAPAQDSGDASRGQQLYATCAACHGPNGRGNPALNTPSLVEQSGDYLVRQIDHFRTGLRGSHRSDTFGQQMRAVVQSTVQSRKDAVDIAAYLGSLRQRP